MRPWVLLAALVGCADASELVVFVDTTLGVPCEVDRIDLRFEADGVVETRTADPRRGVESVAVLREGPGGPVQLRATARKGRAVVAEAIATIPLDDGGRRSAHLVLDDGCRGAPCDRLASTGPFAEPAPVARRSCEGIAQRYTVRRSELVDPVDACAVAPRLREEMTNFTAVIGEERAPSPTFMAALRETFRFRYFGELVEHLWIASDGYVSFSETPPGALASQVRVGEALSSPGAPPRSVLAFWDHLRVQAPGRVCLALVGSGDRETLWITWKNVCFEPSCAQGDDLGFSVGLEEGTNRVLLGFLQMESAEQEERARGNGAAVGLRGPGAPPCSAAQCSDQGLCDDGETPCGFTQVFASEPQDRMSWPARFEFRPVEEI